MTSTSRKFLLSTADQAVPQAPASCYVAPTEARGLMDLLYPGFYMVLLLRGGYVPEDGSMFREQVRQLLSDVETGAQKLQLPVADASEARFAFCALLDEVILMSTLPIRADWEREPLQLELFGDQLAGERFFERLEALRRHGAGRLSVLEVFHMCLLLGFQGRYAHDGHEKLDYLTARLGDEIVHVQGRRAAFAPHWAPPDRIAHKLRGEVPLWAIGSVFAALALIAFLGLRTQLTRATAHELARYTDIVQLAPQPAHITITLP